MSSRRRSPPPKRERADPWPKTARLRTETFPVGVVGVGLAEETRQIPAGEPPPLPPNAELAVVGKPYPRVDGKTKVTGAIRFTVDVALEGMLFARILRSPHPHAEVRAIDTAAAERDPRVRAIVRAVALGDPTHSAVRYVGQPVVAIAATSMAAAEEALRLLRVDYKPLPFVVDLDEARRPNSAKVYDPGTAPEVRRANSSRRPACRSTATCADRL